MDYFGGDFEGIRQKLGYLEKMNVSCIYLNPIFEAHANHRYNTANYLKADPLLGTNEEFARLCAEAKQHGIRIHPHLQSVPHLPGLFAQMQVAHHHQSHVKFSCACSNPSYAI